MLKVADKIRDYCANNLDVDCQKVTYKFVEKNSSYYFDVNDLNGNKVAVPFSPCFEKNEICYFCGILPYSTITFDEPDNDLDYKDNPVQCRLGVFIHSDIDIYEQALTDDSIFFTKVLPEIKNKITSVNKMIKRHYEEKAKKEEEQKKLENDNWSRGLNLLKKGFIKC